MTLISFCHLLSVHPVRVLGHEVRHCEGAARLREMLRTFALIGFDDESSLVSNWLRDPQANLDEKWMELLRNLVGGVRRKLSEHGVETCSASFFTGRKNPLQLMSG